MALIWLQAHAPAYKDIVINETRLASLPQDGQLQVRAYEIGETEDGETEDGETKDGETEDRPNRGPAPEQVVQATETESGLTYAQEAEGANDAALQQLQSLHEMCGGVEMLANVSANVEAVFNQQYGELSDMGLKNPTLWGSAFPAEFMPNLDGTDYPAAFRTRTHMRGDTNFSFVEWALEFHTP